MNQYFCKTLFFLVVLFSHANGFGQKEGNYQGMHWQIKGSNHVDVSLIVDGKSVLNNRTQIFLREIGGKLYFAGEKKNSEGHYVQELFSIKGEKVIPYEYSSMEVYTKEEKGWDFVVIDRFLPNYNMLLYSVDLKLICSNIAGIPSIKTYEGVGGNLLEVETKQDGEFVQNLYTSEQ